MYCYVCHREHTGADHHPPVMIVIEGETFMGTDGVMSKKSKKCATQDCTVIVHGGDDYCLLHNRDLDTREDTHIGDLNSNEKGSGARKNMGKTMFDLVPLHLLAGVARVLTGGKLKYKEWNWAKGMIWSACFNCAMRHMFKFWYAHEELDKESMEHHLDHAMCNLLFLKHYLTYYPDGDDRPPEGLFTTEDIDQLFDADEYCKRNNVGPYTD